MIPMALIHYTVIWVMKSNPWPLKEELYVFSYEEALALCREQANDVKLIGRIQLRQGDNILWDSEFGESYWTISQQQIIEMHIMALLHATGHTYKLKITAFDIQMMLADLTRKITGKG